MDLELYRNGLRAFLKDYQDLNILLNFEEENSDDKLDLYLNMALGFLSNIPPPSAVFNITNFPMPSLLLHQATIEALISNSIVGARNELSYNNGGVSVKASGGSAYLPILQELYRATNQEINYYRQIKVSINLDAAWGGSHSPYVYIAGYPYLNNPSGYDR